MAFLLPELQFFLIDESLNLKHIISIYLCQNTKQSIQTLLYFVRGQANVVSQNSGSQVSSVFNINKNTELLDPNKNLLKNV
jgi:hypothetical protein